MIWVAKLVPPMDLEMLGFGLLFPSCGHGMGIDDNSMLGRNEYSGSAALPIGLILWPML